MTRRKTWTFEKLGEISIIRIRAWIDAVPKEVNLFHSKSEPALKHWLIHCIQSIVTLGQEDLQVDSFIAK